MENPEKEVRHTHKIAANPRKISICIFGLAKCVEKCVNMYIALSLKLDHFYKEIYEGKLFQMHYVSVL